MKLIIQVSYLFVITECWNGAMAEIATCPLITTYLSSRNTNSLQLVASLFFIKGQSINLSHFVSQ